MPDLEIKQYDVHPRLGRHLVLDPRSLAYRRPYTGQPLKPAEWEPAVPVLDQQDLLAQGIRTSEMFQGTDDVEALGSCTGNAGTELVSVLHDAKTLKSAGLDVTDSVGAEKWAIGLYSDASHRDQWLDQTWPNIDCGSSGLGVAKALRSRGLIDQYGHATTGLEFCRDLQHGGLLAGMPWHQAWFEPVGASALLDDIPDWDKSPIAGGHELCVTALEKVRTTATGRLDHKNTIIRLRNHWTRSWGDNGSFRMSLDIYRRLRKQIDLIQPRLDSSR
ncbi:hypothetical protein [Streptomyces sp. NBC_00847]|uniref:hypothetical protein n=1 Tax=Streptomyces sp. NBC_00847 TaxID=2975850 RepID=UPI00225DFC44|nr:hypothetical protein [Streptomyces sp. NBC_00847]MCX4885853.1 hypothetical protein [Streptomyces sp. NBC_00847]